MNSDITKTVANNIRKLRRFYRISREEFCEDLDLSVMTLARIETSKVSCKINTLETIARALKVHPSLLCKEDGYMAVTKGRTHVKIQPQDFFE